MRLDPAIILQQITALRLEFPELDSEEWELSVESETDVVDFLRAVERNRQEAMCLSNAIQDNIKTLQERQARLDRREEGLRALMFRIMQAANLNKEILPEATISIRNGTPRVILTDEESLPDDYVTHYTKPALGVIGAALKRGVQVPGAVLSNATPTLSIRTK